MRDFELRDKLGELPSGWWVSTGDWYFSFLGSSEVGECWKGEDRRGLLGTCVMFIREMG